MDPNELHEQLAATAASIDTGDSVGLLTTVHDNVKRRRRRRRVGLGVCASALLITGGVVGVGVLSDNSGSDTLSIQAPPDTEATPATEAVAQEASTADAAPEPAVSAPAATAPAAAVPAAGSVGPTTVEVIDIAASTTSSPGPGDPLQDGWLDWLVPWQDGFLGGRTSFPPQALPETLPEEIIALFPPEVVEFFNGELPPTIGEATDMLSEAGLLDVVIDVLAEHPEANDAIYGEPVEPVTEAFFTVDGAEWTPMPFVAPERIGYTQSVQAVGDRLVIMAQEEPDRLSPPGQFAEPDQAGRVIVAATSDLTNWDIVEVPVAGRPADLPEVLSYAVYPQAFAANDNGWVVGVSESMNVRIDKVLPEELLAELNTADTGYGYGFDESGLQISFDRGFVEVTDDDGNVVSAEPESTTEYEFTWEELGISPETIPEVTGMGTGLSVWAAPWGGAPSPADVSDAYTIVGSSDGFYSIGDSLNYSPDGVTWTSLDRPNESSWPGSVLSVEGGVIVVAGNGQESDVYRIAGATGEWELLDIPGRPEYLSNSYFGGGPVSPVLIVDVLPEPVPEPTTVTVESDGFVLTIAQDWPTVTITLIGPDGDVLVDDTTDTTGARRDEQVIRWTSAGVDVTDPATGETIFTFDPDVVEAAYAAEYEPSFDGAERESDLWMFATVTGDRWLVVDLDDGAGLDGPSASARNGDTLLINAGGQWTTYDLS